MLFSFTEWLGTAMKARKSAARIVTVREQASRTIPTELAIIIDRARGEQNDTYKRPDSPGEKARTPTRGKNTYTRGILCQAGFVALSTKRGATNEDHLTLLDETIDAFLCAADEAMRKHHGEFEPLGGGYPLPDGQTDTSIFAGYQEIGARYVMQFRIYRGVIDQPIQLGTAGSVHTTVTNSYGTGSSETVVAD
jgi:hypothetical protein